MILIFLRENMYHDDWFWGGGISQFGNFDFARCTTQKAVSRENEGIRYSTVYAARKRSCEKTTGKITQLPLYCHTHFSFWERGIILSFLPLEAIEGFHGNHVSRSDRTCNRKIFRSGLRYHPWQKIQCGNLH